MGLLKTKKRFALGRDIKRLDRSKPIPAAGQGDDRGKISLAFRNRVFQFFGPSQPVSRILDTGCGGRGTAKRMGRTPRTEFEGTACRREQGGDFLEKAATGRRKNPGRNIGVGSRLPVVLLDETVQLRL